MAKGLGTFSVGESSVSLSRGRSAAKAVVLEVSFKELELWAARNGVDEKRLWRKSYGRACKGLRDKFQKVVTRAGGVEGVPKFKDFEAFTKELRGKSTPPKTAPMGGRLAQKNVIVAYKIGKSQIIGWPDGMAKAAVNFQDAVGGAAADKFLEDVRSRARLHRMGIKDVPRTYTHNPRRIIPEPFGSYVKKHLEEWARGAFYKDLARQMAKKRFQ